jgi:hypothetical protein
LRAPPNQKLEAGITKINVTISFSNFLGLFSLFFMYHLMAIPEMTLKSPYNILGYPLSKN